MTIAPPAPDLYLADETAWLDAQADLIRGGRTEDLDFPNLAEFLTDMANRDRREVKSRLRLLLTHLLKWQYQPEKRTGSWTATIFTQADELTDDCESGTLRNHAEDVMDECYARAVQRAAAETGLPVSAFPATCPFTLDAALNPVLE